MTDQTYKKKLIEVALPLEAINAASAREKSIRHGHPSTLHLWWARRPLAACRAVLFAQLVDDPSEHADEILDDPRIRSAAEEELAERLDLWEKRQTEPEAHAVNTPKPTLSDCAADIERKRLFQIVEDLVKWENSTNEGVLERARAEIRRSCGGVMPPIYDPFSGGGSIPLEAQRLGLLAFGSDLNPVAVMIGKAMIEIPPKFKNQPPIHPGGKEQNHYRNAQGLAEDVKYYGEWVRERAFERIGYLFPNADLPTQYGGGKGTVIAWIWTRTVPSPDPAFADALVPVASTFLLSSKKNKEAWIEPEVDKSRKTISYHVRTDGTTDEIAQAKKGTKAGRAMFRCLFSDAPISGEYVDQQASIGRMGRELIGIVVDTKHGRVYLSPNQSDQLDATAAAATFVPKLDLEHLEAPCRGTFASNAQGRRYGFNTFKDYFLERQLVALSTFSELVHEARIQIEKDALSSSIPQNETPLSEGGDGSKAYAEAVSTYLGFVVDKCADYWSSVCSWHSSGEKMRNTFGRQAIPMAWDFAEANPFSSSSGNWIAMRDWVWKSLSNLVFTEEGHVQQHDAQSMNYPNNVVISTDPPYYDNIEYADLSDFFYVWLKKSVGDIFPDIFGFLSSPKSEELVATRYRHGGQEAADSFFLDGMRKAIANMASQSTDSEYPATIYYAFKQSEIDQEGISSTGWATFLQAVVEAGYSVVGTWPLRTEMASRMVASGTNALANSVVLVCRRREVTAEIITRAEFIRALKRELPPAIAELQLANIAPADMPQSAIGPGMGIFSRYKAVLEADDSRMLVKTALQLINHQLDEYLGGIVGEFDADTRFAITWFEQNGVKAGAYGTANNIATARGVTVESAKHAGIVESSAGKVRILKREELDSDWEPAKDTRLTIWECLQHLVRHHEKDGISHDTVRLLKMIGDKADAVKDLAYCLYDICANKRKDAKEATAYNALIADWTDLTREAGAIHETRDDGQTQMDF